MDPNMWIELDRLKVWLDQNDQVQGDDVAAVERQRIQLRILKISEELGEVAEALVGMLAANPRKGQSHSKADVEKELADVAVTALVALGTLTNPQPAFERRLKELVDRVLPPSAELREWDRTLSPPPA